MVIRNKHSPGGVGLLAIGDDSRRRKGQSQARPAREPFPELPLPDQGLWRRWLGRRTGDKDKHHEKNDDGRRHKRGQNESLESDGFLVLVGETDVWVGNGKRALVGCDDAKKIGHDRGDTAQGQAQTRRWTDEGVHLHYQKPVDHVREHEGHRYAGTMSRALRETHLVKATSKLQRRDREDRDRRGRRLGPMRIVSALAVTGQTQHHGPTTVSM